MSNDKRLLKLINEVSRAATSILNVNLMLTTVTQAIQQSFGFYRVGVFRLHSEQKNSLLSDSTGKDGRSFHKEIAVEQVDPLIVKALEQGEAVVIEDIDAWRRDRKLKLRNSSDFFAQGVSSCLIIPLKLGVKIIGVLTLECANLDIFGPSLIAAMETLSDQLAVAIENARLYNELNTNVNELLALNRITQSVSSTLDFQETLTLLAAHVTSMLNVAATSVVLRDDETAEVWFAAAVGQGAAAVLGQRMSLGQGIAGWVAQKGDPLIVPNVHR
ncbi:MAG TPA: GAF domain-containing protein, partial [Anaerolineae bacterium]|nr:GAF domain-containing protein [Anaerolineae bacterium]